MGFFGGQLANVIEWQEYRDDVIFWKWENDEIKRGSKLIIRAGQDAVFMYNGRVEGIFTDEGSFDIESDIIPFLSTLKGFTFGFNSGMRAEVLFINTKEFTVKWGTKNAINLPVAGLPGGMPIRSFGTFQFKVADAQTLIDKVAGIKRQFTVDEVKERVLSSLDMLLMKWIASEGKDMFNLQANAYDIGRGVAEDLDMELCKLGITVTGFQIQSVSYPDEVAAMQKKAAAAAMVGNINSYTQVQMAESLANGSGAGSMASDMAGMQMGMMMGQQMMNQMSGQVNGQTVQMAGSVSGAYPKFCSNCGSPTDGGKFCSNCGQKLV